MNEHHIKKIHYPLYNIRHSSIKNEMIFFQVTRIKGNDRKYYSHNELGEYMGNKPRVDLVSVVWRHLRKGPFNEWRH